MNSKLIQPYVTLERHDSWAIIRLNRPEKLNALSPEMLVALRDTFKELENERDLRALILTGVGERAFSAGTELKEFATIDEKRVRETSERGQEVCNQIENCPLPVIAAINGLAVGGGCELALASHIRLASTNAQFSLPETKQGVAPGYCAMKRLTGDIGYRRALEMMLAGKTLSAEEALSTGLLNQIAAQETLLPEAVAIAEEIAKLAPLAIRACLQSVIRGLELPLEEGLALEAQLFATLFATKDMREGTNAFLEKRQPFFKGV